MKYIDSEKLIAEIERLRDNALERQKNLEKIGQETIINKTIAFELNKVLSIIDSLQQDKDVLDLCSQVWWEDRGWMMIPPNVSLKGIESLLERVRDKIKWNKENGIEEQEQPKVDIEKEIEELWKSLNTGHDYVIVDNYLDFLGICLHCFELGLNARKV